MAPRNNIAETIVASDDNSNPNSPKKQHSSSSSCSDGTLSECERLYGPYPDATPLPWKNSRHEGREGDPTDQVCDFRDAGSPDAWLPRDGRLVRLTGKHPFNVEPPLAVLKRHGFLTPASLHYVRNHGACPQLAWETHTISVNGGAAVFTMDQIAAMPARELPVTLVCAGNRRKEQNMLRQTIGT